MIGTINAFETTPNGVLLTVLVSTEDAHALPATLGMGVRIGTLEIPVGDDELVESGRIPTIVDPWLYFVLGKNKDCAVDDVPKLAVRREFWWKSADQYVYDERPAGGLPWAGPYTGETEEAPMWVHDLLDGHITDEVREQWALRIAKREAS